MVSRIVIEGIFLFFTFMVGILTVGSLIVVMIKLQVTKSPPLILLLHLQCLMLYRLIFCFTHNLPEYFEKDVLGDISFPIILESICSYADQMAWYVVLFNHVLISVYRYIATCRLVVYHALKSRRCVLISLLIIWLLGAILVIIPAIFGVCCPEVFHYHVDGDDLNGFFHAEEGEEEEEEEDEEDENFERVSYSNRTLEMMARTNYIRNFTLSLDLVSLFVIFWCFWRIQRKMKRVQEALTAAQNETVVFSVTQGTEQTAQLSRDTKITLQFFFISIIFTLVSFFIFILQFVRRTPDLISVLFLIYCLNSVGDALVMYFFNPRYFAALRKWVCCKKFAGGAFTTNVPLPTTQTQRTRKGS